MYPGYEFKAIDGLITNFHFTEININYACKCICKQR
ncbi:hypothetical protein ACT7DH_24775 [Bacillus pacificus]